MSRRSPPIGRLGPSDRPGLGQLLTLAESVREPAETAPLPDRSAPCDRGFAIRGRAHRFAAPASAPARIFAGLAPGDLGSTTRPLPASGARYPPTQAAHHRLQR